MTGTDPNARPRFAPATGADHRRSTAHDIELAELHHTYQVGTPWARPALHDIDLVFPAGERALVVGDNGSGKSTLAWILAGMVAPSSGRAMLGHDPLVEHRDRIGLVIQHTRLQLLRPTIGGELNTFTDNTADQLGALAALGFDPADRGQRIDSLSIGQQRRVGLAVQLARRTPVLILDEPMAGLDRSSRRALVDAVGRLSDETTVITVTHDLEDSAELGHRVIRLADGRLVGDEPSR
ncbi:MAG: ABC transporter ATP-binding protein [Actinomycetota bacterium]